MGTKTLKKALLLTALFSLCGCSGVLDFNRIQGAMDTMAYNTGVMAANMPCMAYNMGRMSDATERLERKSNGLVTDLKKQGPSIERSVQNYAQTFIDNDRALIKSLKDIRGELSELRQSAGKPGAAPGARNDDQSRINTGLQDRINQLEARLATLNAQLHDLNKKPPQQQR